MIDSQKSVLLMVDLQQRLLPAIENIDAVVATVGRLAEAARILEIPVLALEQSPRSLGPTEPGLARYADSVCAKLTFDGCGSDAVRSSPHLQRPMMVIAGLEAHVCVLQTSLGLLGMGKQVFVVRDAVGTRRAQDKLAALDRLARHGAEIVTSEMVVFEWLRSAEHPRFREVLALIK